MTGGPGEPQSSVSWNESADRVDMSALGLRIVFARDSALWTHSLLVANQNEAELVRAVESDHERDDPASVVSPVYQEIQRHEHAGDARAAANMRFLLTGTFFKHHFSAVASLEHDPDRPDTLLVDFDVADRCRSAVNHLAATYTVRLDSGALVDAGPRAITWHKQDQEDVGQLELEAIAPSTLVLAEAGRGATRVQVLAAIQPGQFTHRLHYRWRWTKSSGLTR